jgi:hypothetical protein
MRNIISCAAMLFLFTGCVTVPEGHSSLPTSRTFHADFDRVWSLLVSDISSFAVIKTIDKTSGLITTGPLKMGAGLMSEMVPKEYAHRPTNILHHPFTRRGVLHPSFGCYIHKIVCSCPFSRITPPNLTGCELLKGPEQKPAALGIKLLSDW